MRDFEPWLSRIWRSDDADTLHLKTLMDPPAIATMQANKEECITHC
jgi:hypothetical protein